MGKKLFSDTKYLSFLKLKNRNTWKKKVKAKEGDEKLSFYLAT